MLAAQNAALADLDRPDRRPGWSPQCRGILEWRPKKTKPDMPSRHRPLDTGWHNYSTGGKIPIAVKRGTRDSH
jgi:hypothetical protein